LGKNNYVYEKLLFLGKKFFAVLVKEKRRDYDGKVKRPRSPNETGGGAGMVNKKGVPEKKAPTALEKRKLYIKPRRKDRLRKGQPGLQMTGIRQWGRSIQ